MPDPDSGAFVRARRGQLLRAQPAQVTQQDSTFTWIKHYSKESNHGYSKNN